MKSPEEIEKALQRLMPAAFSSQGEENISRAITRLASSQQPSSAQPKEVKKSSPWSHKITWSAAAAVLMGIGTALFLQQPDASQSQVVTMPLPANVVAVNQPVLIDRVQVSDSGIYEGTLSTKDGSMMSQVNRRIQTRERYRDPKSGYLITISESRDEKVLVPKTRF
jgi:hypothetical protein